MKTGIVLVGHGSREPYNKETVEFFASALKSRYDFAATAFMQINEPSIPQVIQKAVDAGMEKIIVVPVFISRGVHTDQDIPEQLALPAGAKRKTLKTKDRNVLLLYTAPIGKDPRILDIINSLITSAEASL